jgi:RNA polymerase sigma factor (sigma-70 family)
MRKGRHRCPKCAPLPPLHESRGLRTPINRRDSATYTASASEWLESPYLRGMAARLAHQYHIGMVDLPDLLQEIRIALWGLGPDTRVSAAWVFKVASHKVLDLLRHRLRARHRDREFAGSTARPVHDPELDHLLHARVARLPTHLREFYELHYLQGLSEREIAQRLLLCRASVRWLDRCCRQRITGQIP